MSQNHSPALFYREWAIQKAGLQPEQNEDACVIRSLNQEADSPLCLIAVADGATEAVYSRLWARQLVEAASPDWPALPDDDLSEQLKQVGKAFSPIEPGKEIPWFVRNKYLDQGSQATLLVATLAGAQGNDAFHIRAVSVGDCCLLLFKASGEVISFPMQHSDEFGVNPVLLGNRIARPARYDRWEAQVEPGDMILFGTDAMSKWALQCLESRQSGLLFEGLLGLLGFNSSDSSSSAEGSSPADSLHEASEARAAEEPAAGLPNAEKPARRSGWLKHLWPWANHQPLEVDEITETEDAQPPIPEAPVQQGDDASESVDQPIVESADEQAAIDSHLKFEQFIERYRAPDSLLHMRNDDSTLVVCLPVRHAPAGQELEALRVIRGLQSAVAARLQAAPPTGEVGSN
ncbi:MAG: protein phosphatase 2C domain-containing protein [Blastocatellia bacterium]